MGLDVGALLVAGHILGHKQFVRMLVAILLYRTDRAGRDASDHSAVRDVVGDDRACPDDAVATDGDPRQDHGVHTDVAVVSDGHAAKPIAARKLRVLMAQHPAASIVGGYLDAARYANVVPDSDEVWLGAQLITIEDLAPPPDRESASFQTLQLHPGGHEAPNDAIE